MRLTRRNFVAALPLAAACTAAAPAPTLFVTPDGEGDGGSWDDAASLADLDDLLGRLAPGGEVQVAADRGVYVLGGPIEIGRGGRAGRAARVRGVNSVTGAAEAARLRGERGGGEQGLDGFRLLRGAGYLHFSHFAFERVGNGCFRIGAPVRGLTVEDCTFQDIYRFFENTAVDGEHSASLRDFIIRRCNGAGVERGFLRIRYASRDGVIENCSAQGTANEGGFIPVGCALDDSARSITYRRVVMENFQQWRSGEYWNGDGFSDEENNAGIVYDACSARGATDGGFDCKSRDVMLKNCVAEDNKRNFRIWSDRATLMGCTSRSPHFRGEAEETADACHLWIGGDGAQIRISAMTIEDADSTAILEFEHDSSRVEFRGLTINSPRENWFNVSVRRQGDVIVAHQD